MDAWAGPPVAGGGPLHRAGVNNIRLEADLAAALAASTSTKPDKDADLTQ